MNDAEREAMTAEMLRRGARFRRLIELGVFKLVPPSEAELREDEPDYFPCGKADR